jgi:hypothetical protein
MKSKSIDTDHVSILSLNGLCAARRTSVCVAGAAAWCASRHDATLAVRGEEGDQPFGSIAVAFSAGDRRIGIPHGTQGVEMMFTVQTDVFVNRHKVQNPYNLILLP